MQNEIHTADEADKVFPSMRLNCSALSFNSQCNDRVRETALYNVPRGQHTALSVARVCVCALSERRLHVSIDRL